MSSGNMHILIAETDIKHLFMHYRESSIFSGRSKEHKTDVQNNLQDT
jgi:hypothetical protein